MYDVSWWDYKISISIENMESMTSHADNIVIRLYNCHCHK